MELMNDLRILKQDYLSVIRIVLGHFEMIWFKCTVFKTIENYLAVILLAISEAPSSLNLVLNFVRYKARLWLIL